MFGVPVGIKIELDGSVNTYVLLLGGSHSAESPTISINDSQSMPDFTKPKVEVSELPRQLVAVQSN
jgi:hypothetical protein